MRAFIMHERSRDVGLDLYHQEMEGVRSEGCWEGERERGGGIRWLWIVEKREGNIVGRWSGGGWGIGLSLGCPMLLSVLLMPRATLT